MYLIKYSKYNLYLKYSKRLTLLYTRKERSYSQSDILYFDSGLSRHSHRFTHTRKCLCGPIPYILDKTKAGFYPTPATHPRIKNVSV